MPKLDLEPLELEPIDSKSDKLDLEPLALEPMESKSHEEVPAPSAPKQEWSGPESAGQGVVQGATMGFSDELGGALGAGMEKLAGNPDDKSMSDLYHEYRDLQRRRNKGAEESNPKTYLAGNIAGGVGSGIALPGAASLKGAAALGAATGLGTSEAELGSGDPSELKHGVEDVAIGSGLGLAGGVLGKGLSKAVSSAALRKGGSRLAADVAGISPEAEQAGQWIKSDSGKWIKKASPELPGTGEIALREGAVPTVGGNSAREVATQQAIDSNYDKLNPLLQKAQQSLDNNLDESLNNVGHVGDKLASNHYEFQAKIGDTDQASKIADKLLKENKGNIQKAAQMDGNLEALNAFKRDIQAQADAAGAFGPNQNKPAAQYLKSMSGVIRQHIEDLANAADPQSQIGSQVKDANNNISKLIDFKKGLQKPANQDQTVGILDSAKSYMGPGILSAIGYKIGGPAMAVAAGVAGKGAQMAAESALGGQSIGTTGKILAAKGMMSASKAVDTPLGKIVLKPAPVVVDKAITSPFSQEKMQNVNQRLNPSDSTKIAATIYNADDASLKKIANDFKQDASLEHVSNKLDSYIKSKDPQDLNAAVFLMLQNKNARKLLTGEE